MGLCNTANPSTVSRTQLTGSLRERDGGMDAVHKRRVYVIMTHQGFHPCLIPQGPEEAPPAAAAQGSGLQWLSGLDPCLCTGRQNNSYCQRGFAAGVVASARGYQPVRCATRKVDQTSSRDSACCDGRIPCKSLSTRVLHSGISGLQTSQRGHIVKVCALPICGDCWCSL
jgi:hypothetical protein